ncbi:hypothetical protein SISSUDRAFT_762924 [Sistotremastrum suecicum HHB10207 ss-3]|uniref:Uncharacterized protein n=1 Tax=Sistotremastrum suecicum HHB10207 ss-3 TaxID=1314776 RepID=A0A166DC22_9AGAM|nr:hypothetical protein SISSUDRAFT_762924 [Sistotremastrum suecicum HHB10207 ss-3]
MASVVVSDDVPKYSCQCLNVRIFNRTLPSGVSPPESQDEDPHFKNVYIAKDGIEISQTFATLRSRSKPLPAALSEGKVIQYTELSCLLCGSLVYRVPMEMPENAVLKEGPIITSIEDWVESEILLGKTGFVEVSLLQTLEADGFRAVASSSDYSPVFKLVIPNVDPGATSLPSYSSAAWTSSLLPHLPDLAAPPPYSPSHPTFQQFVNSASRDSARIREEATNQIRAFALERVKDIEAEENILRRQINILWTVFRDAYRAQRDKSLRIHEQRSNRGSGSSTPTSVKDFSPVHVTPRLASPATSAPRVSALSSSRTSYGSHFPAAMQAQMTAQSTAVPVGQNFRESDSLASTSTLVESQARSLPGRFIRNTNPDQDLAMSLKVASAMVDAHMARSLNTPRKPPKGKSVKSSTSMHLPEIVEARDEAQAEASGTWNEAESRENDKKRERKVKFAIRAAQEKPMWNTPPVLQDPVGDEIFLLEDPNETEPPSFPTYEAPTSTTNSVIMPKRPKPKPKSNDAIMGSFGSLRPASLPAYTNAMRERVRTISDKQAATYVAPAVVNGRGSQRNGENGKGKGKAPAQNSIEEESDEDDLWVHQSEAPARAESSTQGSMPTRIGATFFVSFA